MTTIDTDTVAGNGAATEAPAADTEALGILAVLTLAEVAKVEKAAQLYLGAFGKAENMSARLMAAFAWVITQRTDPTYSLAQAFELTLVEVNHIIGAAADPTRPPMPSASAG